MKIHVVQRGDTLWKIAKQYGVSVERLISDNHILDPRKLVVGQALLVLIPQTIYTVRRYDTLASIACRFHTTEIELMQNNPELADMPRLHPGQVITIRFTQPKRREIAVNSFAYTNIREDLLKRTLPFLTYLTIFGYQYNSQGKLIPVNDERMISLAERYKTAPVMSISNIDQSGGFSGDHAALLLRDPQMQKRLLDQIVETMQRKGYRGLDIDFEQIPVEDRDHFNAFLEMATERMNENGYFVNTDVVPKTSDNQ